MRCTLRRSLLLIAAIGALAAVTAPAFAATWVSYRELLGQVYSGHLIRAIINPFRHDVEIKFPDLDEWHAHYPVGTEATLSRVLHDRHVRVLYVPRPKPPPAAAGHRSRYLAAAGSLCLLAVLLGGWFIRRRRRRSGPAPGSGR